MKILKKLAPNKSNKKSIGSRLSDKRFNGFHAIVTVILFGAIGIAVLQLSNAATTSSILDHADWTLNYPAADAHITNTKTSTGQGNWNQGNSSQLWINNQNGKCQTKFPDCFPNFSNSTYLKFNVSGATGKTINRALVKMYVIDGSPGGGTLYSASNNWAENTITWNSAPGYNVYQPLASAGKATTGQWVSFNIDLKNNPIKADGTYSFVVASQNQDPVVYSSREGSYPPQLVLVFDSPPIYNIPTSISSKVTCTSDTADQTSAINSWLSSVPDGSVARFANGMCYHTEGTVLVANRKDLIVDGNGSTLKAFTDGCASQDPNPSSNTNLYDYCKYPNTKHLWPRNRYSIDLQNNKNVTIRNIAVNGGAGSRPPYVVALEAQTGFHITQNNDGVLLDKVAAGQVRGDYVYVDSSQNVTIQNSNFTGGAGRQGFAVTGGTNIFFQKNNIAYPTRSMIDLEPNTDSAVLRNIHIENNVISSGGGNGGFFSCSGADAIFDGIYFSHNTIRGSSFGSTCLPPKMPDPNNPATYRRHNFQFVGNTSDTQGATPYEAAARIRGIDGILFQDNSFVGQKLRNMVIVQPYYSRNIRVINNKLLYGVQAGRYTTSYEADAAGKHTDLKNVSYCEKNNSAANPLVAVQSPSVPVCSN